MSLGVTEILIVLAIVLIVFGAGKLPNVMGDLAKGVRNFKAGLKDEPEASRTASATSPAGGPAQMPAGKPATPVPEDPSSADLPDNVARNDAGVGAVRRPDS